MRLLDTRTLELKLFIGGNIPPYAILSHTWGDDEVLYEDMYAKSNVDWRAKTGAAKVLGAAAQALSGGYDYVWIDSCCIDKSSSAELSEAVNSMYNWYKRAAVCYAYLSDVNGWDEIAYRESRWFTRGWTLQELIAPKDVVFFDSTWEDMGRRDDMIDIISSRTRIDPSILQVDRWELKSRGRVLADCPVSERMLWAAGRETRRSEDMAYCLMGIFDVNMPLLYGEGGRRAFRRLQEEIIKYTKDHSVLLHSDAPVDVFATIPNAFDIGIRVSHRNLGTHIFRSDLGVQLEIFRILIDGKTLGIPYEVPFTLGVLDCCLIDSDSRARPCLIMARGLNGVNFVWGHPRFCVIRPTCSKMVASDHETSNLEAQMNSFELQVLEQYNKEELHQGSGRFHPAIFKTVKILGKEEMGEFRREKIILPVSFSSLSPRAPSSVSIQVEISQPKSGRMYEFGPSRPPILQGMISGSSYACGFLRLPGEDPIILLMGYSPMTKGELSGLLLRADERLPLGPRTIPGLRTDFEKEAKRCLSVDSPLPLSIMKHCGKIPPRDVLGMFKANNGDVLWLKIFTTKMLGDSVEHIIVHVQPGQAILPKI